jgi:hypothetical protein
MLRFARESNLRMSGCVRNEWSASRQPAFPLGAESGAIRRSQKF